MLLTEVRRQRGRVVSLKDFDLGARRLASIDLDEQQGLLDADARLVRVQSFRRGWLQ